MDRLGCEAAIAHPATAQLQRPVLRSGALQQPRGRRLVETEHAIGARREGQREALQGDDVQEGVQHTPGRRVLLWIPHLNRASRT